MAKKVYKPSADITTFKEYCRQVVGHTPPDVREFQTHFTAYFNEWQVKQAFGSAVPEQLKKRFTNVSDNDHKVMVRLAKVDIPNNAITRGFFIEPVGAIQVTL